MTQDLPTSDGCCCLAVRKAARHVTQHYDRHLAPAFLTVTQFSLLARVERAGRSSIGALASSLAMDRTTLGRTLRPLARDGLLVVGTDGQDGRRRALSLTEAGRARLRAARPLWREAQSAFDRAFGPDRSSELRHVMAAVLSTDLRADARPPV